jgi:hypothetical protein
MESAVMREIQNDRFQLLEQGRKKPRMNTNPNEGLSLLAAQKFACLELRLSFVSLRVHSWFKNEPD